MKTAVLNFCLLGNNWTYVFVPLFTVLDDSQMLASVSKPLLI